MIIMNIKLKKIGGVVLAGIVLAVPVFSFGASNLIVCDGIHCNFNDLIKLANVVVKFLFIDIAMPLVALGIMYAGARLIIFQNKEKEKTAAKEMLTNIGYGFALMLGTFVLIKFVLSQFLSVGFTTFLLE
jgi:hypothetical protein